MSLYNSFFDPFVLHRVPKIGASPKHRPAKHVPYGAPISEAASFLPIKGQGTIAVNAIAEAGLLLTVSTDLMGSPNLYLDITTDACVLYYSDNALPPGNASVRNDVIIPAKAPKGIEACYLIPGVATTYWLSIDRANGILRYGKGFLNKGLTLLEAVLKKEDDGGLMVWTDSKYSWLSAVDKVEVEQFGGDETKLRLAIQPLPIVRDLSPFIIKDQDVSLIDLENGLFTVPENLPDECQKLYHNVAGPNILLDTPDFPDFSKAIERSVNTKGLLGYKLLQKKAGEFGKDNFDGTYLRITLGYDLGDSPGIPYVLEIWPSGHYSPIHDHGDAFAVIKVLHGSIDVYYFDSLEKPGPHLLGPPAVLKQNDLTWISNQDYQIHQLQNQSTDGSVCCTIQCYQYGDNDTAHFEFFRYIDADNKIADFPPNSDMAFGDFRKAIKAEWDARPMKTLAQNEMNDVLPYLKSM